MMKNFKNIIAILALLLKICDVQYAICQESSSKQLVIRAWEAHGKNDIENTFKVTQQCIDLYLKQARQQQASLKAMPLSTR